MAEGKGPGQTFPTPWTIHVICAALTATLLVLSSGESCFVLDTARDSVFIQSLTKIGICQHEDPGEHPAQHPAPLRHVAAHANRSDKPRHAWAYTGLPSHPHGPGTMFPGH